MQHGRPNLELLLGIGASTLALLIVALVNGGPIVYPDSVAYMIDGERLTHLTAPYGVRAVFYGVAIWLLHVENWFWIALAVQALIVAHVMWLTARAVGFRASPAGWALLTAALAVLTPVSWHVSHLLPDIFVPVMVLALFLLGFCQDRLHPVERAYLVLLASASASFHLTAMPVAAMLAAVAMAVWLIDRRAARPGWVALPLGLALVGSLTFNAMVWNRLTLSPNSPPFLLARQVADGPARDFLKARCGHENFELCHYLDVLPDTEERFMWIFMDEVSTESGKRIKAEAGAVVGGTLAMFPGRVAWNALRNGARQLVAFTSETALSPREWNEFQHFGSSLAQATKDTLQAHGWLERPQLALVNQLHAVVIGLSLLGAPILLVRAYRNRVGRHAAALVVVVLLVLIVNAFVTGPVSGVFNRFEGRVIWLLPFAVAMSAQVIRSGAVSAEWKRTRARGLASFATLGSETLPSAGTGFRTGSTPR